MRFAAISVQVYIMGLYIKLTRISIIDCIGVIDEETKASKEPVRNPFLKPNVFLTENSNLDLNIDSRYRFKPGFAFAPFSTVGDPWPLPKYYKSEKERLLLLQKSTFKMTVVNDKPCDILTEAIKRYKNIIENHITEEHYYSPFNFNEQTFNDRKKEIEKKYESFTIMPDLEIFVMNSHCEYPHVNMNETYRLKLRPNITRLTAREVWGALRGLETFSQLLFRKQDTDDVFAKVTEIVDGPRFPHRGIMIDTARHYMYKSTIKDVLDGMAYNKLNVLHWHIVDDNSFPYQSEVFPKLSEKAAFHPSLVYTLKDIKEIVEYARYRGIRVIPEFDTPGHSFSWFAYPEIVSTCYERKYFVGPLGPINPAQNLTYSFMAKLFGEIYNVFPESFVHLGGDELKSTCWATNPNITSYLETHGGIPASEAKSDPTSYISKAVGYYFNRLITVLQASAREKRLKKEFIVWGDGLTNTDKVPSDSVVQIWIGGKEEVRSVNERGYRAIHSSCWYLDRYAAKKASWFDYYRCEPSPYRNPDEERGKLLGGEACLWAEYITTDALMVFMWPRAAVPAERLWSPKSTTDLINAQSRLQEQRCRMIYRGLATGHISGPDYCLRPKVSPRNGSGDSSREEEVALNWFKREDDTVGERRISKYSHLSTVSVVLYLVGVCLLMFITKVAKIKTKLFRINYCNVLKKCCKRIRTA